MSQDEQATSAAVLVTGATGLIGGRVTRILVERGQRVVALVRDVDRARKLLGEGVTPVPWDFEKPDRGDWKEHLEGAHGVVHLAGTPLFAGRWTAAFKKQMEESRVLSTRRLVEAVRNTRDKPRVFVSASAIGIYGTDPDRICDESSEPARDLLARVCVNWENEARRLESDGVRTVQIRTGIVLHRGAGVLAKVVPLFKAGMGGTLGLPHPAINWIHLEDAARIFVTALFHDDMRGPFNAVAPNPVTNQVFARTLAAVLGRPALVRHPVALLRLVIGEAAAYSSGGPRVRSDKIQQAGYRFFFTDLEAALGNALGE